MPTEPYRTTRTLHLYLGLFLAPFTLIYALSVFFLVHNYIPGAKPKPTTKTLPNLPIPANLATLTARPRLDALSQVFEKANLQGELGFIVYHPKQNTLWTTVTQPGRLTDATLNLTTHTLELETRETGLWDATITLHKLPGPHLIELRGNWFPIQLWRLFADSTVYLLLFITLSGIYLWYVLRAERRIGLILLLTGALTFWSLAYAIAR